MRKVVWGVALLVFASVAQGGGPKAVRRQLEASMQVTGTAEIDATGALTAYALDDAADMPPGIVQLLHERLPGFRFEAVVRGAHAQPVAAKMTLLLVAHRTDAGHYDVRMESARFVDAAQPGSDLVSIASKKPPEYPVEALERNVGGTVYVAVRIDRSGHAVDVAVKQVNLTVVGDDVQMRHWRDVLARPALAAIRQWTFHPPATGPHAGDPEFVGIVPVRYLMDDQQPPRAGHWSQYVRGPVQDIPWLRGDDDGAGDEAVAAGSVGQRGATLKLLTPLDLG
jgi:hypothetical protein